MLRRVRRLLGFDQKATATVFSHYSHGTTVPSDGATGYVTGCLFQKTDGGVGTAIYLNEGSATSADFNAYTTTSALLAAVAGTVTASLAVIVDANKDAGDFRNLDCVNLDAGSSGAVGTVDVFPATASRGKFKLGCQNQDGDTLVTLQPAAMGQATVVSIPDPGAATANVMLTDQANDGAPITATSVELNVLDGVTGGASLASKGLVLDSDGLLDSGPLILADMTEGSGITGLSGGVIAHSVRKIGGGYKTEILLDITGLHDGDTADDIIGKDGGTVNCHIGQITAAKNGTLYAGRITCFETPVGGNSDIDLWSAVESSGAQDAAISGLDETSHIDHGAWTAGESDQLDTLPGANKYLYLVCGVSTDAVYTAGRFLIELWGA